jgi:hypothetical protein
VSREERIISLKKTLSIRQTTSLRRTTILCRTTAMEEEASHSQQEENPYQGLGKEVAAEE